MGYMIYLKLNNNISHIIFFGFKKKHEIGDDDEKTNIHMIYILYINQRLPLYLLKLLYNI